MIFDTSAMSCCGNKSIKMVPTSFQKQPSNQHPNLNRFGSQLGSILEGFGGSRWGQVGTKSHPTSIFKSIKKMITFWIALGTDFDRFWDQLGLQNGHQMDQKSIKNRTKIRCDFGCILDSSCTDFCWILAPSWGASWSQVDTRIRKIGVPRRCQKSC